MQQHLFPFCNDIVLQEAKLSLGQLTVLPHNTFEGHVRPSVTLLSDSPYAISYWWSFGTKPLSLTVSQIFNVECRAMVDMTLIRPLNEGQGNSFGTNRFLIYDFL